MALSLVCAVMTSIALLLNTPLVLLYLSFVALGFGLGWCLWRDHAGRAAEAQVKNDRLDREIAALEAEVAKHDNS